MGKTPRKSFAKQDQILELPNMLKIQKDSYEWFLREGLREVFRDVDTITDYTGNLELSFLDYSMNEPPKYSVEECKERDATYAKPIKVRVRLHNKETDEIKEQEIFMGDFPLMTNGGTFGDSSPARGALDGAHPTGEAMGGRKPKGSLVRGSLSLSGSSAGSGWSGRSRVSC